MEDVTCGFLFKPGQPGGAGADSDGLKHAQEAGGTDGEAPHDSVHVEKHLTFEVIPSI